MQKSNIMGVKPLENNVATTIQRKENMPKMNCLPD